MGSKQLMAFTRRATLNDLLERVLDRGLVLDADLIIMLAGVPLIGVKLRAALAGMETMGKYGLMTDWDRQIREDCKTKQTLAPALVSRKVRRTFSDGARSR